MPAQINLHELINQPGYGKAEKALRKAGMWRLTPVEMLYAEMTKNHCPLDVSDGIDDAILELTAMEGNK